MSKKSLIIIVMCLVVVLFSALSSASANDAVDNMTATIESEDQTIIQASEAPEEVLGDSPETFTDLADAVHNDSIPVGGTVTLDKNYTFSDGDSSLAGGISVDKSITIDGQYNTIDGANNASVFRITNNAHVILKNIIFINGNGTDGGAIYVESGSSIEIINCTFRNNSATNNGGAIYIANSSASVSTIIDSDFISNSAGNDGGAIYSGLSTLNVELSAFSYNRATSNAGSMYVGGAVHIRKSTFDHENASQGGAIDLLGGIDTHSTIENSTFENCYSSGDGGAVYIRTDNAIVENVGFSNNVAGDDGGAIFWEGDNGVMYNITCTNNKGISIDKGINDTSSTRGGTICLTGDNVTITKSSFTSSSAYMDEGKDSSKVDGGAIFVTGNGVIIDDVTFDGCNATNNGGAVYVLGNLTKILNCDFTDSRAGDGAALFINGTGCELYNTTFKDNMANDDGGAIFWNGDNGLMYNITCENNKGVSFNTSSSRGGTICLTGDNVTVNKSTFKSSSVSIATGRNSSKIDGGAIFVTGNGVIIDDVTFDGCSAANSGGAVYVLGNYTKILNCDFTNSLAGDGAALFINGTGCELKDSTFTDNIANDDGGAIFWEGDNGLMYNITCENNMGISFNTSSSRGGTICLTGDNVTVNKSTFISSSVSIAAGRDSSKVDGGALFITGNDINIIESDFIDCNAVNYGGAVYILGNNTKLLHCDFNNTKALVGGAVYIAGNDSVVDDSLFRHNEAKGATLEDGGTGGGVYIDGKRATISNSDFAFDEAVRYGGAISVWGPDAVITNNVFEDSSTTIYYGGAIFVNGFNSTISLSNFTRCNAENTFSCGGAIEVSGGNANISECNFDDCYAYYGGDIHINGANAVISDSNFEHNGVYDNAAPHWGGAIYVNGTNTSIIKSNFSDFTAEEYGGAIYVAGTKANISQSNFEDCDVKTYHGGAIYIAGEDTSIEDSNFTLCKANNAESQGGAIYVYGANAMIKGSSFDECVSKKGGDIYVFGNYARIEDSTFNLSSANYGGAIYLDAWGAVIKGSNITECDAGYSGGAIYVAGGGTKIIGGDFKDCVAKGTTSDYGGGAIYVSGPDTEISDSDFNNNKVTNVKNAYGGTIYINGERTHIYGSTFNNSGAYEGGIIYIEGIEAIIDSSTFGNTTSNSYGGAISIHGDDATIRGSTFENIAAKNHGGAIYVDGKNADILYSSFYKCTNGNNMGGAIYINNVGTTIAYSNFTLSQADKGGAIYISGDNTTVSYCNLNNNTASTAGAIHITGTNTLISNSNLDNNTASTAGAIKVSGTNTLVSDCNFTYNFATVGNGGAMDLSGKNASVRYSLFDNNDAKLYGGAINWDGGHGEDSIIGTTFTNNYGHGAGHGGGAIYWTAGDTGQIGSGGLIKDSIFINNTAQHHGGAIDWFHSLNSTIDNCLFINNLAKSDGGALYTGDQKGGSYNFTISNSQFYNNTAGKHGGAIANQMTHCSILNNTFDGNRAGSSGGTILMKEATSLYPGGKDSIIDGCFIYNSYCEKPDTWGQSGGAIHIGGSDKNVTISNCAIINSTCKQSYGGAISIESPDCSLINVTIQNVQTCDGPGGAIHWSGSNGVLNNVTIFNSSSHETSGSRTANGGAIYLSGSDCTLNVITISSSSANLDNPNVSKNVYGGAVYVDGDHNTITNIVIDDSKTSSPRMNAHGGAIFWSGDSGTLINATISNTLANGQGGAIYWSGSAVAVENISIEYSQTNVTSSADNAANGGAIYSTGIDELKNVYIINALASASSGKIYGGAIYYTGTYLNNVTVIGSRASSEGGTSKGGAVYWKSTGTGNIYNSSFENNTADLGGAVVSDRATSIYDTSFTGNVARDGGALYATSGDKSLNNVTFELNSAKRGGALYIEKILLKIDGSTLTNNTAEEKGGAIYYIHNSGLATYIRNSDIVNNTAFQGSGIYTTNLFELTNVTLLDNQANSKEFIDKHVGVDEEGKNYTSAVFVGFDNLLNAIWDQEKTVTVACNNVTYWGVGGKTVSNSVPVKSDREVWQNITVEMFNSNGEKINEAVVFTDASGRAKYIFDAEPGETYYFAFTHKTDRYYTYLRDTLANRSLVKIYAYTPIYYNQNQTLLISLTDGAWGNLNGTVNITFHGPINASFLINVTNGTHTIANISGLPLGIYNVTATYDGDIDHTGDSDWVVFEVLPYDDLHITKGVNITADYVNVSDIIKYTINVTNHGPSEARCVNVTEILSTYLSLISNQTTKGYYNYTNGTWVIGDLNVNETVTLTIVAQVIHRGPITNTVWVTGAGIDTNMTNNIDSAHNFTALPILDLYIAKDVNVTKDPINVLDIIKFNITVFNDGPSTATGVVVGEVLDHHIQMISWEATQGRYDKGTWNVGNLTARGNATLTIVAKVVYSGNISNAVHVYCYENETNYTNNYAAIKNITAIANVDVGIIKTVNVTGYVNVTDYVEFNITVYNNGPCNATGVYINETLDYAHLEIISNSTTKGNYNGYSWVIDLLNKGEVVNLTIIAKVIDVGSFGNAVRVFTADNDTNTTNDNATIDNITALPIVDLAITKEVTSGAYLVNVTDEVSFTITVKNNGYSGATNVTVTEVLSSHLRMVENKTWIGYYNVTSGIWYIGDLKVNETVSLYIRAVVISNGTISNFVSVNSTENDTNKSNNNYTIGNITALPIIDLNITKEVSASLINVTDMITFTITVTNEGPCNATNVNVTEILDSDYFRLISNVTTQGYYNLTSGVWFIGNLDNHTNATLTLVCKVVREGLINNHVEVFGHENETDPYNNHRDVSFIALPIVDIAINKTVNVTNFVDIGALIEFTITVYNYGPSNATSVYVAENITKPLHMIKNVTSVGSYDGFTWWIGDLANGTNATMTIICEVADAGNITNYVNVTSYENDTNMSNNYDNITNITSLYLVDVGIIKSAVIWGGGNIAKVGDIIQFDINVDNYGPCDATNVTVSEELCSLLNMTSYTISGGGTYNVTSGIWYIGNLPNKGSAHLTILTQVTSAGNVSNFVSVNSTENDTNPSNNNFTIVNITAVPAVNLIISKNTNVSIVTVGELIQFNITVFNDGPSNATRVNVSEILNKNFTMISNTTDKGYYNITGGYWYIGDLNKGETATLTIVCKLTGDGIFSNYVEVSSYENETYPWDNWDIVYVSTVPIVDIAITKKINGTPKSVIVGSLVEFTITVHNYGPSNATSVLVNESIKEPLYIISNKTSVGEYDGYTWNIGDLANNATATLTIVCEVRYSGVISNYVNVTSYQNDTNMSNNYDNITNITSEVRVDVGVIKTVNVTGFVYFNDYVEFNITVYNNGTCNATSVSVIESLDTTHLELISNKTTRGEYDGYSWHIGNLNKGENVTMTIIAQVKALGSFGNAVIVKSYENDTNTSNNNYTIDNITAIPAVDLNITKEVNVTGYVNVTDRIKFIITVHNYGPSNATNVNVTEELNKHLRLITNETDYGYYNVKRGIWYIGNLDNGSTATLTLVCKVVSEGIISNFVSVNSTENETHPIDNNDTIKNITALPIVDLNITKEVIGPKLVNVTDRITFVITVFNKGYSNATNVNVTEVLDNHLKLISNETEYGYYDVNAGVWYIGNLNNGTTAILTIVCEVTSVGTISNFVSVNSTENETNPIDNNVTIDNITALPIVDLNITKTVNVTSAYVGDMVRYTINVTNHGPCNATDVVAYDKLSDLLEFIGFVPSRDGITYNYKDGKITIGNLNVNETVILNITAKVRICGIIPNLVNVTSHENDTNSSNNNDTSDNITASPVVNLVVVKYSNVTGTVNVNDLVRFTIEVTNNGPSNATWVSVSDELDSAFGFVNATGNWTIRGQKVTWTIPRINNGTATYVYLFVRVLTNGTFENIAFANSSENSTDVSNKTNVTANPVVDLKINKTVNVTKAYLGDYIKYTIYVVNNGPSNATDVYAVDELSSLLQFTSFNSSRDDVTYDELTGRIAIGAMKVNETIRITIIAQVRELGIIPNIVNVTSRVENDTNLTNNNYTCKNVTASKIDTPIYLDAYDIYYGDEDGEILTVFLPKGVTGTVNITVNEIPYNNIPITSDGIATLPLYDLGGGDYYVDVVYGGDETYIENSTSGKFKVLPLTPTIRIEVVDIWHGEVEVLNVTVNAPGSVNITVYGRTVTIPLDHQSKTTDVLKAISPDKLNYDGKATWILINLPVGRYPAFAVYNGNENYTSVSTSDVFYVKDKPSTVIVTADDIHVGEDAFINIKVGPKDFNGTVKVIVEGKVYNNVKLVNGKANLTVSGLKAGLKHVYVKFDGDILYRASENTTTFNVLKFTPPVDVVSPDIRVGQDGVITVKVPKDATGTITIEIEGRRYTQPIVNGKAVFVIPGLEVGVHAIKAFYSGNDKYYPNSATGSIRVIPVNESVANHTASEKANDDNNHKAGLAKYETGNPILILLLAVLAVGSTQIRKFKK